MRRGFHDEVVVSVQLRPSAWSRVPLRHRATDEIAMTLIRTTEIQSRILAPCWCWRPFHPISSLPSAAEFLRMGDR